LGVKNQAAVLFNDTSKTSHNLTLAASAHIVAVHMG
jgi:hypothetical protein